MGAIPRHSVGGGGVGGGGAITDTEQSLCTCRALSQSRCSVSIERFPNEWNGSRIKLLEVTDSVEVCTFGEFPTVAVSVHIYIYATSGVHTKKPYKNSVTRRTARRKCIDLNSKFWSTRLGSFRRTLFHPKLCSDWEVLIASTTTTVTHRHTHTTGHTVYKYTLEARGM